MKTIRWGMIGCGDVAEVKSGPALQKARNSALVAVMRRNAAKAQDFARRHNVSRWSADAEELLRDPGIDALYIATPPDAHMGYTLRALEEGKAVYVEKPMARTHGECVKMNEAARHAQLPLFVAYYRRALPRFFKIKELIESGAIGTPRFVHVTLHQPPASEDRDPSKLPWRVLPEIAGAGKFLDLASHMLDFLDFVFGPIRHASGAASNQAGLYPAEDIVSGHFVFESGIQGSGTWCFSAFDHEDRTEIVGTNGKISYSTFNTAPITLKTESEETAFTIGNPEHIQQPLIQTVVDALNGQGSCPSTGESAARTSRVMDQMLEGWRCKRK